MKNYTVDCYQDEEEQTHRNLLFQSFNFSQDFFVTK